MIQQQKRLEERANASQAGYSKSVSIGNIARKTPVNKGNAAVFSEADAEAWDAARVVPVGARLRTVGAAVLGYAKATGGRKTWQQVAAGQRFNELARLAAYRHRYGLALGPCHGWARVLVDLAYALHGQADALEVSILARRLRAPSIDPDLVAGLCAIRHVPLSCATVGDLLEVTSLERDDCRLLRIDACDEPKAQRRRRLDRERKARVRRTLVRTRYADRRIRMASPALRALRSSTATVLPLRQDPHRTSLQYSEPVRGARPTPNRTEAPASGLPIAMGNLQFKDKVMNEVIRLPLHRDRELVKATMIWFAIGKILIDRAVNEMVQAPGPEVVEVFSELLRKWAAHVEEIAPIFDAHDAGQAFALISDWADRFRDKAPMHLVHQDEPYRGAAFLVLVTMQMRVHDLRNAVLKALPRVAR